MTLVSSLITDAYRESNMLPLGKDPTAAQVTEALRLYNALVKALYGDSAGERLQDWPLGNYQRTTYDWQLDTSCKRLVYPPVNQRLIAVNEVAVTLYFSQRPQDGSRMAVIDPFDRLATCPITLEGNGRTIEGATSLVPTEATEWFYRADKGDWTRLTTLASTDESPFPDDFDTMFIIMLAMRLSPRYGRELDQTSLLILKGSQRDFVNRYLQSRPLHTDDSISWPFMSKQAYGTDRDFSSTRAFGRGSWRG